MPIRAQAADGTIHEFPDGTRPEAVDRAMKGYAQSKGGGKAPAKGDQSFSQAFFGKMGRDMVGLMNPALTPIVGPMIDKVVGANTVRDFTQRAVQPITLNAADEVVSAVPAAAAARRGQPVKQTFSQSQRQQSQERAKIQRERPKLATVADLTGGAASLALPIPAAGGFIKAAPNLMQTALRTGAVGAGQGYVGGFLAGEEGDRLDSAGTGAVMGAAIGAGLPYAAAIGGNALQRAAPVVQGLMQRAAPMVEGVGRAVPAVDDLAGNLATRMRGMGPQVPNLSTPEQIALRHVNRNLQSSGMSLDDLRAAPEGITAAEAMGRTGQRQLGALARMEGETADSLQGLVSARSQGRTGALSDAFGRATGVDPEAAAGNIDVVVDAGRRRAAPLYEQAYADTIDMTPTLQGLTQRPSVQKAMRNARTMMQNDGLDPDALGLTASPQSGDIPIMEVSRRPSMQLWDYVKRGLDDEIDALRDPISKTFKRPQEARQLTDMAQTLRGELTSQSPAYRQALETSGDYLKASTAFKKAPDLVFNNKLTPREFAQQVAKMTEGEREALRAGIANHALNLVDSGRMKPKAFSTPGVRQKLGVILGEDGANGLIETAELEARKAAFETRYGPGAGSISADMLAGGEELAQSVGGGPLNLGRMAMNPVQTIKAGGEALINRAYSAATQPGQAAARDAIGQRYMMSPQALADYLEANPVNVKPPILPGLRAPNPFAFTAPPPRAASLQRR